MTEFPRGPTTTSMLVTSSIIQKWLWPGLYNHNSPLLRRKAHFIYKWKEMNRQSPNNNRKERHDYKNNNGRNFQFTKFSFIDFVLTDRKSLSGKRPKSASGKSSSCRFSFSAERNANTKATEYVTFGFSFSILVFFLSMKVWTSLSVGNTDFLVF